ncbi:hypothetical protein QTP88_012705 [Uroleucon formosanum]
MSTDFNNTEILDDGTIEQIGQKVNELIELKSLFETGSFNRTKHAVQQQPQVNQNFNEVIENQVLVYVYLNPCSSSKFTNNGVLNKQNNRYWTNENPHWAFPTNFQTCWGTNVWVGLIGGKLPGPHFYDGTLTRRRYLDFLLDDLQLPLNAIPLDVRRNIYYQQDKLLSCGAPAHNAQIVQEFLRVRFGEKFIATHGPVEWPPRSPDLIPLDFFFVGTHEIFCVC